MNTLEWDGIIHNETTKRGEEIIRVSKKGNVRIVYRKDMIQGKYAIQKLTANGYWDGFSTAMYSSDSLSEVEKACRYMVDEPIAI